MSPTSVVWERRCILTRKRLFAGGPPENKNLYAGGPPANKKLFAGGPPANKKLFAGGLPTNKTLFSRALLIKLNSFKHEDSVEPKIVKSLNRIFMLK